MKNLKANIEPQVLKSCLPMTDYMTVSMGTSYQVPGSQVVGHGDLTPLPCPISPISVQCFLGKIMKLSFSLLILF